MVAAPVLEPPALPTPVSIIDYTPEGNPRRDGGSTPSPVTSSLSSGLIIVSFARDLPWFAACAKSVSTFTSGFDRKVVLVPIEDAFAFQSIADANGIELIPFHEPFGKGHLAQQLQKSIADETLGTDYIFHIDSDCVFVEKTKPQDFLADTKPILPFNTFAALRATPENAPPGQVEYFQGVVGLKNELARNRYYWKGIAEWTLGERVDRETMAWMPIVHKKAVYKTMRGIVENRFGMCFEDFVWHNRNEFPASYCEFNSLGGVAQKYFPQEYAWHDLDLFPRFPSYKVCQSWSHGGLDAVQDYPAEFGGLQTPRELFTRLGLL